MQIGSAVLELKELSQHSYTLSILLLVTTGFGFGLRYAALSAWEGLFQIRQYYVNSTQATLRENLGIHYVMIT